MIKYSIAKKTFCSACNYWLTCQNIPIYETFFTPLTVKMYLVLSRSFVTAPSLVLFSIGPASLCETLVEKMKHEVVFGAVLIYLAENGKLNLVNLQNAGAAGKRNIAQRHVKVKHGPKGTGGGASKETLPPFPQPLYPPPSPMQTITIEIRQMEPQMKFIFLHTATEMLAASASIKQKQMLRHQTIELYLWKWAFIWNCKQSYGNLMLSIFHLPLLYLLHPSSLFPSFLLEYYAIKKNTYTHCTHICFPFKYQKTHTHTHVLNPDFI